MTARRTTTQRVHLAAREREELLPARAPWWWPVIAGLLAGLLSVAIGVVLTLGRVTPDPFSMGLIGTGIALIAGINTRAILARGLGPVGRALAEADERSRDR